MSRESTNVYYFITFHNYFPDIRKRPKSNFFYAGWNFYALQSRTSCESTVPYICDILRYFDFFQMDTVAKRSIFYSLQTLRKRNTLQTSATIKAVFSDSSNTFRNVKMC